MKTDYNVLVPWAFEPQGTRDQGSRGAWLFTRRSGEKKHLSWTGESSEGESAKQIGIANASISGASRTEQSSRSSRV